MLNQLRVWLMVAVLTVFASVVRAQDWGQVANVSASMGVNDGRVCVGEASRGDLGCPTYAPYVSATSGWVGIGTTNPAANLEIANSIGDSILRVRKAGGSYAYLNLSDGTAGNDWRVYNYYDGKFSIQHGTQSTGRFLNIDISGNTGLRTADPSSTLHVNGGIRLAMDSSATTNICDTNRSGAIRYSGSAFQVCYGTGGWANLTDASGTTTTADRITSGTAQVIANGNSNSISITEAGVTTGYYYNGIWVAGGVSTTGTISGTNGYISSSLGIGTATPSTSLVVAGPVSGTKSLAIWVSPTDAAYATSMGPNDFSFNRSNVSYIHQKGINGSIMVRLSSATAGDTYMMNITLNGIEVGGSAKPSTTLAVSGTLQIANSGEACDANRSGAIRYTNSTFQVCYGTGGWANLADASSTVATADRITSGTAQVIANGNSNSISITEAGVTTGYYYNGIWVAGGVSTTGPISATNILATQGLAISSTDRTLMFNVNNGANSSGYGYLASIGTPLMIGKGGFEYGKLALRGGSGQTGYIDFASSKGLNIYSVSTNYMWLASEVSGGSVGKVAINTSYTLNPYATLEVSGTVKLGYSGEACDTNRAGAIRYTGGIFQTCDGTGWASLLNTSSTLATGDRITSGTSVATLSPNGNLTVRGLIDLVTNSRVVGIGQGAALANTGASVTAVGYGAAQTNSGNFVTALGAVAAQNNTGANLTASGYSAAMNNIGLNTTAIGYWAAANNTASYITALGSNAAQNNAGSYLVAVGLNAATSNTANYVTALGSNAAQNNTGTQSTAVGYYAAQTNLGSSLSALGYYAAQTNAADYVTALGYYAGANNGIASPYLTAVGASAARSNSGSLVTALGYSTGTSNTFNNVTLLGGFIFGADKNNQVVLGNGSVVEVSTSGVYLGRGVSTTGVVTATAIYLADNPTITCGPATYGTTKFVNGRPYYCRP
ncbi:hypothetical protein [Mesorhizobium sp. M0520]|uniref:beta strand repeat-containing protein n=1 Tax=Mesorhizobium sp. M0520 TaxID=2956957 RepID=UPI00333AD5A2